MGSVFSKESVRTHSLNRSNLLFFPFTRDPLHPPLPCFSLRRCDAKEPALEISMSTTQEIAPLSVAVVALDDAIQHVFDYEIPDIWRGKLHVGMRVKVPVRTTVRQGTVIELKETSPFPKLVKIREVLSEKVFLPPISFNSQKQSPITTAHHWIK